MFEYKTEDEIKNDSPELADVSESAVVNKEGIQLGVIAQEYEQVLPDSIMTTDWGVKTINTDPLVWHLVNAIKELTARVKELESRQ